MNDPTDLAILRLLQSDNRRSAAEVGQAVGLSVSAAGERIRRLNAAGVIAANRAVVSPRLAGLRLAAFMFVDLAPGADEDAFVRALDAMPEVQEAHHVTGAHSWLLKIRCADTDALQALMTGRLKNRPDVLRTETLIVLATGKETTELALAERPDD
ncbi:MAG: Lrp/AsnC family transcriptional regulator [Acetobacteraceae bacterium]|nr:Lrp/AsnC family transcriptional regulator [Acetobacteraceae bacterium]